LRVAGFSNKQVPGRFRLKADPMQRTPFEWLSEFLIPFLMLGGTITTVLKDQPQIAKILAVATIFSVALSVAPSIIGRCKRLRGRVRADRVARAVWPELVRLVGMFGKFIDSNRSNTLHGILMQFSSPERVRIAEILRQQDFVPSSVLYGPWKQLYNLAAGRSDTAHLQQATEQFTWLVGTYSQYVIQPVFSRAANSIQEHLTPQLRQELATCRDSLTRFLDDYEALLTRTNAQFGNVLVAALTFPRIPPL
jgi:hypothetical protein